MKRLLRVYHRKEIQVDISIIILFAGKFPFSGSELKLCSAYKHKAVNPEGKEEGGWVVVETFETFFFICPIHVCEQSCLF